MRFEQNHAYHLYNRGNNKVPIFFNHANYVYFLKKVRNEWLPFCEIINYCLMPNHFHFIIAPKFEGCQTIHANNKMSIQKLSKAIGKTLSSYTQAINIQNKTVGTLFQKKTKAKCLTDSLTINPTYTTTEYLFTCFHYIHFNPAKAKLVTSLHEWPYSSWLDYYGYRNGSLCNQVLGRKLIGLNEKDLKSQDLISLPNEIIEDIW
ncbi:MAG: hypothetical protein WCF67_20730 [Chitinophagaceae bacterium]